MPSESFGKNMNLGFSPEYEKANLEFANIFENKNVSEKDKLTRLLNLADQIGENVSQSDHFNNVILERWVRMKDPELYKMYKLEMIAA